MPSPPTTPVQRSLFGHEAPRCDAAFRSVRRIALGDGAWIDHARGWLEGHEQLFEDLERGLAWRSEDRVMYERRVEVPRLYAVSNGGDEGRFPILAQMRAAIERRYGAEFPRLSYALYRDGRDSVAWHGDYVARRLPEALVATVSVGAPRKFLLRPTGGGASIALSLGWGDLVVMGGTCQRTHQHAIPKVASATARIAIMYRPVWHEPAG
jgi:alkylated DNA repair dioxygenase AlkB